jgi:drug/metabolite transporter (DMT)-like permease
MRNAPTWKITLAMAIVYIVWGSTYLGIRFAVETIPPFMMAGMRQFTAGVLLYAWLRHRGAARPEKIHWRSAVIIGGLMLLLGNGCVAWAERVVPSGLTALLIATTPVWMVLLEWLWHGGARPGGRMVFGLVLGFAGAGLLVSPGQFGGGTHVDPWGGLALFVATVGWAVGTMYSRRAKLPASALLGAAMEMAAGGALLLGASAVFGEWRGFAWSAVSTRSWVAMVFLTVFGSMLAYTAYMWLIQVSTPARVSTNAFVNPIVAVVLGWWLAGEPITARIVTAAVIIVVAVVLIIWHRPKPIVETP